jgi:transposase
LNYAFVTAKEIKAAPAAEDKILTGQLLAVGHTGHKYAVRLQVVSRRANGKSPASIAEYLGININTVTSYVKRYNATGPGSLPRDKTRKPGTPPVSEEIKNKVIDIACHEKPEDATHRSTRSLAKRFKVSRGTVSRILRERGIKSHLVTRFSFSNDPQFVQKLTDVVGLYMNPPDNATVLCANGKSRIQAPGRVRHTVFPQADMPAHQSRDCCRHGTAALFTAPDYLTGNVIGDREDRHTSEDYLKFLNPYTSRARTAVNRCGITN